MLSKKACSNIAFVLLFFAVLLGCAGVSAAAEDQDFSLQEGRFLTRSPSITPDNLADGSWFTEFESYCKDQFTLRETCMERYYAFLDLMQVNARNGYVRGNNNHILNIRSFNITPSSIASAGNAGTAQQEAMVKIRSAAGEYGGTVLYMNIPYKMEFFADMYPDYYESGKEVDDAKRAALIRRAEEAGIPVVETYDLLDSHRDEYIFFTTDHHWTVRGAYYGYQALLERINSLDPALNLQYPDFDELNVSVRRERMVGSYLRKWGDGGSICDDYMEYAIPYDMPPYTRYENGEPSQLPLLDTQINGYSAFMYGDYANTFVDTGREELPSILYVGFSYTNPLEFMSVYNFGTVESLDPRHFTGSICEHIRKSQPDYIVIVKDDIYEGNREFSCVVE